MRDVLIYHQPIVRAWKSFSSLEKIDEEVYKLNKAWLIACGNTTSYGGGLNICPHANPD